MARRRKGLPIDGWLNIDKPLGLSSSAAVGRVRRLMNAQKAGHAGTLDPLASGVLPVALGEATKTSGYLMSARKKYRFEVTWGEARDTADAEGAVIQTSEFRPTGSEIEAALPQFAGTILQTPPVFSAIKIGGQRAYALARSGNSPDLQPREVQIHRFALVNVSPGNLAAEFEVVCGKGTYVRSLAVDLAEKLGTVGYVSRLRRCAVGPFQEENAITLDNLEGLSHSAAAVAHLLPVETPLDDIPAVAVTDSDARRLQNGQPVDQRAMIMKKAPPPLEGLVLCKVPTGRPVALCKFDGAHIRPVRVFNLQNS